jgi:AmmeMemoRadiSam system protein B
MSALHRPQLRPYLTVRPEGINGHYLVEDRLRLSDRTVRVTAQELGWLSLFDGHNDLNEIRKKAGAAASLDSVACLAGRLETALFLDGRRYREAAAAPVRQPTCLGSYEPRPAALRRQLDGFFVGPTGPGRPGAPRPDSTFRGALVPHIDYGRGGATYAWVFKEIVARTAASLFVIIGTSHFSRHRFTLTRKHFRTPLGIAPTDTAYIDRLAACYGEGLFDDELMAHLPEHSIELEVVFLQYLYPDRPFRIVPLVVGSFRDAIESSRAPAELEDVGRMVASLREAERRTPEPICYLISGDLAHLGPKFGDRRDVHRAQLAHSRRQDGALLGLACRADSAGYFRLVAAEGDARRVCGLPPTYTALEALRPRAGKVLHYDQWVDPSGYESVSFAGMAFFS